MPPKKRGGNEKEEEEKREETGKETGVEEKREEKNEEEKSEEKEAENEKKGVFVRENGEAIEFNISRSFPDKEKMESLITVRKRFLLNFFFSISLSLFFIFSLSNLLRNTAKWRKVDERVFAFHSHSRVEGLSLPLFFLVLFSHFSSFFSYFNVLGRG